MRRAACAIALAGALVFLLGLGRRDFWEPDEPRHGAIAEEMRALQHGPLQLVVPRLNGEIYTQKPPLYYWLAAVAGAPRDRVSESAARLPSALAALATSLVAFRLGAATLGAPAGVVGAALLVSLPAFVDAARQARPDALLALLVSCAVYAFWRIDRGLGSAAWNRRALHLAVGLGMLTKGPVAALLPLLGTLTYLAWEGRLRDFRRLFSRGAWLLSVGPALGWLTAAWLATPAGFLHEAVAENVLARYFSGLAHEQSAFYYLRRLPIAFLPWTLVWPLAAWRIASALREGSDAERARGLRFLLSCAGAGLAFFTLSVGKRSVYLLPLYPVLALLSAEAFRGVVRSMSVAPRPPLLWGAPLAALVVATLAAAGTLYGLPAAALAPGLLLVAALALLPWERLLSAHALAARGLAVLVASEAVFFGWLQPRFDCDRSVRGAATAAAAFATEGTPIGLLRNGSLAGGIVYYSGHFVTEIGSERGLRRFLESGGRVLILETQHLGALASVRSARVVFRQEIGGDEILVVRVGRPAVGEPAAAPLAGPRRSPG